MCGVWCGSLVVVEVACGNAHVRAVVVCGVWCVSSVVVVAVLIEGATQLGGMCAVAVCGVWCVVVVVVVVGCVSMRVVVVCGGV